MGYDYCFFLSVDDIKGFEAYKQTALDEFELLKLKDWFPVFGDGGSSGPTGYGCGSQDNLIPEFRNFTMCFPDFTFKLWLSYYDHSHLYMVEVKDDEILSTLDIDDRLVEVMPGVKASVNFNTLEITNDITDWFT